MRIVAEPLYNTNRLLVRLLGADVVSGSYTLDARPVIKDPVVFDVVTGMIRQEEVRLYFTGFLSYPDYIKVTKPDASTQVIHVVEVTQAVEPATTEQPVETITKDEKPILSAPTPDKVETVSPPEVPKLWCELAFERSDPVGLGTFITADPLVYTGGGAGRIVTGESTQEGDNTPTYLQGIGVRLEGSWENSLDNSSLTVTELKPFSYDKTPVGWDFQLVNPDDMIRIAVEEPSPLPMVTLTWRPAGFSRDFVLCCLSASTAHVTANKYLQFIASPAATNDRGGYLRLETATGLYLSVPFLLEPGVPLGVRFNVQDDPGPVKIYWYQRSTQQTNQSISLVAPLASSYDSLHSWGPGGSTSDLIVLPNVTYDSRRWNFLQGRIRVDSDVESKLQPLSWAILSDFGHSILKLDQGILSSDYSTNSVTLSDYLPESLNEAGNYKIKWSQNEMRLVTRANPEGTLLPFLFNVTMPTSLRENPIRVEIKGFSDNSGSGLLRYWSYLPS